MIRDLLNTYSSAQALTSTGDADSTNIIDQLAAGDPEQSNFLRVTVNTGFTSGGSGTLAASLVTSNSSTFASGNTTFPLFTATAVASLTAGKVLYQGRLPIGMKRYHKIVYTVGTAAMTAGKVDAYIVENVPTNKG